MSDSDTQERNKAIYGRVMEAFKESHGFTQHSQIVALLHVNRQMLTDWKKGKSSPQRHLRKIANLTGKSIEWFHLETADGKSEKIPPTKPAILVSDEDKKGCTLFRSLLPVAKVYALAMLEGLARQQIGFPVNDETLKGARKDRERKNPGG